jgi:hypothetical protein
MQGRCVQSHLSHTVKEKVELNGELEGDPGLCNGLPTKLVVSETRTTQCQILPSTPCRSRRYIQAKLDVCMKSIRRLQNSIEVRQVSVHSTSESTGPKRAMTGDCMTQRICSHRQQMSLTEQMLGGQEPKQGPGLFETA